MKLNNETQDFYNLEMFTWSICTLELQFMKKKKNASEESYSIEYIKADFFLQYAVAIKIFMQLWDK